MFGRRWVLVFAVLALAGGAACGTILGIEPGILETVGDGGDAGAPEDGASHDTGGSLLDTTEAVDALCDRQVPDDEAGVFVATTFGKDQPGCGTRVLPCKTIQTGVTAAAQGMKSTVYVGGGLYDESVALASGVAVVGGWTGSSDGGAWVPICNGMMRGAVTITGVTNVTVSATSLVQPAALYVLTVQSKPMAAPGESLFGVLASGAGTKVTLGDVYVTMANGGDGLPGDAGAMGAYGAGTCEAGTGAPGNPAGSNGTGAGAGTFGPMGYEAPPAASGTGGAAGSNGTPGVTGSCLMCITTCSGLAAACNVASMSQCGSTGGSGCGGAGGGGGGPGGNGGSSVCVLAWDATVDITSGLYVAGNGGAGGAGGHAGGGGGGSPGTLGMGGSCNTLCNGNGGVTCVPNGPGTFMGGGPGGSGGPGSGGGTGGGGLGGSSFVFVQAGDAGVIAQDPQGQPTLVPGDAGLGGGNGAANGKAAPVGP